MNYFGGRRNGSGGFIMSFWLRLALFLGILFGLLSGAAARARTTARTRTTASSLSSRSTHQRNYRNKKRWNYLRHRRLRQQLRTQRQGQKHDDAGSSSSSSPSSLSLSPEQETRDVNGTVLDDDVQPQEQSYHEDPPRQLDTSTTIVYYVHSELGRDTNTGTTADGAVRTIQKGLNLIRKAIQHNKKKTPSTPQNTHTPTTVVILELTGTFSFENIVLTEKYSVGDKSTSTIDRFIIRGSDTNKKKATILGGQELDFVKGNNRTYRDTTLSTAIVHILLRTHSLSCVRFYCLFLHCGI